MFAGRLKLLSSLQRAASTITSQYGRTGTVVFKLTGETKAGGPSIKLYLNTSDRVPSLQAALAAELASGPVTIDVEGDKPTALMTVGELVANRFTVKASSFSASVPALVAGADGDSTDNNLTQKATYAAVLRALEESKQEIITYDEFTRLCTSCGVPSGDVFSLCRRLHSVAAIQHFPSLSPLSNIVFTRPDIVIQAVYASNGELSPQQAAAQAKLEKKREELSAAEAQLSDKLAIQQLVRHSAERWAERSNALFGLSLAGGIAGYAYLSFVELSWDIMEPVTYLTGTAVTFVGCCWWFATAAEFEYSNIYGVVLSWRTRVKHRQLAATFRKEHGIKPRKTVLDLGDGVVHPIMVPSNADQLEFEAEVDGLKAQVAKLKGEVYGLQCQLS